MSVRKIWWKEFFCLIIRAFCMSVFAGEEWMVKNGEIGEKLEKKGYLMPKSVRRGIGN
jgi:hypothetical protein